MQDRGLSEFKSFSGFIQAGGAVAPITFRARVDRSGEVEFGFDATVLTKETAFIVDWWDVEGSKPGHFLLSGQSEDGTEFKTEDLHFTALQREWNEETGDRIKPVGACSRAIFHRKLVVATH